MFAGRFSLEATRPSVPEVAEVAGLLGAGGVLYLSSVPSQPLAELAATAALVRRAGLEPVVHLPARRFSSVIEFDAFLARTRGEADLRRVLVIAGDNFKAGVFTDALAVIRSGALQKAGIEEIGVAGYPEGHPIIAAADIERALHAKIAAASTTGLRLHVVSQFCFAPDAIIGWLSRLRGSGVTAPVKVGMAGPASLAALLRYAKRCGVGASLRGLMSGAASGLLGHVGPDRILAALATGGALGDIAPHYFSFGGVMATARYAHGKAAELADVAAVLAARRSGGTHAMTGSN